MAPAEVSSLDSAGAIIPNSDLIVTATLEAGTTPGSNLMNTSSAEAGAALRFLGIVVESAPPSALSALDYASAVTDFASICVELLALAVFTGGHKTNGEKVEVAPS